MADFLDKIPRIIIGKEILQYWENWLLLRYTMRVRRNNEYHQD